MKIDKLNLIAFGHFTDRNLGFAKNGLHIVYGSNEAGKSTALRALKSLLYGIEERTTDDFKHQKNKLRIAGVISGANSQSLSFIRRKGRGNTLLDEDKQPIDQEVLAPFLQGITSRGFETLFGIDHKALVQGGQDILDQKGEIGQALFSAALGANSLHSVLCELQDEAGELFRPQGSKQKINSQLKDYKELKKAVEGQSLSSTVWTDCSINVENASNEVKKIKSEIQEIRNQINLFERIKRVAPKLAFRRGLLVELEKLSNFNNLPKDFKDRFEKSKTALEKAQNILLENQPIYEKKKNDINNLVLNNNLLSQATNIDALFARLGIFNRSLEEAKKCQVEADQLRGDVEYLLKEINPDISLKDIDELRRILTMRERISELGKKKSILCERLETSSLDLEKARKLLNSKKLKILKIPEFQSTENFEQAINAARKLGEIDTWIEEKQYNFDHIKANCDVNFGRLSFWKGQLSDVPSLKLPNQEQILHYDKINDGLCKDVNRLEEHQEKLGSDLREVLEKLDAFNRVGRLPTKENLRASRAERDRIWKLLHHKLVGGGEISPDGIDQSDDRSLPKRFEVALLRTDKLSDQMWRDSARIHELADLKAKQKSLNAEIHLTSNNIEAKYTEIDQTNDEWQKIWETAQIHPESPQVMLAWLDQFEKLRNEVIELNTYHIEIAQLRKKREKHKQSLLEELEAFEKEHTSSDELEVLLSKCEKIFKTVTAQLSEKESLRKELQDKKDVVRERINEYKRAAADINDWDREWGDLMKSFHLRPDSSPSDIDKMMESLRSLLSKQREEKKKREDSESNHQIAKDFENDVMEMVRMVAPELADLKPDIAVNQLRSILLENQEIDMKRLQLVEEKQQVLDTIDDAKNSAKIFTEKLNQISKEVGCRGLDELELFVKSLTEYIEIKEQLTLNEKEIFELGDGHDIHELEKQAASVDIDCLPGQLDNLKSSLEKDLEPRATELAQELGGKKKELELMNGSDSAAKLADQRNALLASIKSDARRYVIAKLSERILKDQIEKYRRKNQGPLLERASKHFSALTLGSFVRLSPDFNDRDLPILTGIREDGSVTTVDGMSSGTRDQLYLALRIASLEKYMASADPMPFIVDDILVDFDDERSQAALKIMAELANKTQVILFTHHSKIVELASQFTEPVQVHEL